MYGEDITPRELFTPIKIEHHGLRFSRAIERVRLVHAFKKRAEKRSRWVKVGNFAKAGIRYLLYWIAFGLLWFNLWHASLWLSIPIAMITTVTACMLFVAFALGSKEELFKEFIENMLKTEKKTKKKAKMPWWETVLNILYNVSVGPVQTGIEVWMRVRAYYYFKSCYYKAYKDDRTPVLIEVMEHVEAFNNQAKDLARIYGLHEVGVSSVAIPESLIEDMKADKAFILAMLTYARDIVSESPLGSQTSGAVDVSEILAESANQRLRMKRGSNELQELIERAKNPRGKRTRLEEQFAC